MSRPSGRDFFVLESFTPIKEYVSYMAHVFLDESGQFTPRGGGHFFVVGSFTVGEPRRTEKQFRSWQHSRFPKKLSLQSEIKFSDGGINNALRLRTLKFISGLDVRVRYTFLRHSNIPHTYWEKDRLKSGHLYADIIGKTLQSYLPTNEGDMRVFCDERHLRRMTKDAFSRHVEAMLRPRMPQGAVLQVEMLESSSDANVQIADWITGAMAWYLEEKPGGDAFYAALKNNLLGGGEELFLSDAKAPELVRGV